MEILKIKTDKTGRNFFEYQVPKKDGYDIITLDSADEPLPDYTAAFLALRKPFLEICEYSTKDDVVTRTKIKGVSLSWQGEKGDRKFGATITGIIGLNKKAASLMINTPHLFTGNENTEDSALILPVDAIQAIETLLIEAEKYINGERSQIELFGQNEKRDLEKRKN